MIEPKIFSAQDYGINANQIDTDAIAVVKQLRAAQFEAFIVGGAVRDLLLGKTPKDFDVATSATPAEIRKVFRNSRIIGRRFQIGHVYFKDNKIIEVATFRQGTNQGEETENIEVEAADNLWGSPQDDAMRRDLTINALFFDPQAMTILDYVDGMKDLQDRRIRIIGEPELRFREDPVRMLRTIRHAARTSFLIEPTTWSAIKSLAELIKACNHHRLHQEMVREFEGSAVAKSLKLQFEAGLLDFLMPDLAVFYHRLQSRPQQKRVYWKLLKLLDRTNVGHFYPLSLQLAVVFGPLIIADLLTVLTQESVLPAEQIQKKVQKFITSLALPKVVPAEIGQILHIQAKLDHVRADGSLSKKITQKSYFAPALELCALRHQAMGSWLPEEWLEKQLPANRERLKNLRNTASKPSRNNGDNNKEGNKEKSHPQKRRRRRRSPNSGTRTGSAPKTNGASGQD